MTALAVDSVQGRSYTKRSHGNAFLWYPLTSQKLLFETGKINTVKWAKYRETGKINLSHRVSVVARVIKDCVRT